MEPQLLKHKAYDEPSVFRPENLLREARRQNKIEEGSVPPVCLLDPDGDIVRHLRRAGRAEIHPHWPGYHTTLYETTLEGRTIGLIGCAVGASFAVLVAEQLFVAGCELLLSLTSAGQIVPQGEPPYFVLIEEALRDEGTSYHYRPPSSYAGLSGPRSTTLQETGRRLGKMQKPDVLVSEASVRVGHARDVLEEMGGLPQVHEEGQQYRLEGSSCPLPASVRAHGEVACDLARAMIEELTELPVERRCDTDGECPQCEFVVDPT